VGPGGGQCRRRIMLLWRAVVYLNHSDHPLLDLGVLGVPTFRAASVGGSFFRMAIGAAPFLLPSCSKMASDGARSNRACSL